MDFLRNEKGTVTLYLVISYFALVIFIGLFVDLARIKAAQNRLRGIAHASARSVLANYNTPLKDKFGLFALNQSDYEHDFQKYIEANLLASSGEDFNLFDYRYEGSTVSVGEPLTDSGVLKRQILQEMKYEAPLRITTDLIKKLKPLGNLAQTFDSQNSKRQSVKHINSEIKEISEINKNIKGKKEEIKSQKVLLRSTSQEDDRDKIIDRIEKVKQSILADLEASKTKRREIEQEINALGKMPSGLAGDMGNDTVNTLIRDNVADIDRVNIETLQRYVNEVRMNTEQAITALKSITPENKEINETLFSAVNLDSADTICRHLEGSKVADRTNELAAQLKMYREKFYENPLFQGLAVEAPTVTGGFDSFGADDSDKNLAGLTKLLHNVAGIANFDEALADMRDELFINEYALTHFSCLTGGLSDDKGGSAGHRAEVEYVLYGTNPEMKVIRELYQTRFALDTLAYFLFSRPPAPTDLLLRAAYSLVMGTVQAAVDTYKLLTDDANTVALAEMMPDNPLKKTDLNLNYQDHLRLFMALHQDESGKLRRMAELIKRRQASAEEACTKLNGSVRASVRLWFLPMAGFATLESGPFGTEFKDGRCYITKRVEFAY